MADMDLDDLDSSTALADASEIAAAHAGRRGTGKAGGDDSSDEGEEDDFVQDEELQVGPESREYDAVWLVRVSRVIRRGIVISSGIGLG